MIGQVLTNKEFHTELRWLTDKSLVPMSRDPLSEAFWSRASTTRTLPIMIVELIDSDSTPTPGLSAIHQRRVGRRLTNDVVDRNCSKLATSRR